jgi:nucleotide-binding universal stress UspA family protein
MRTLIAVDGGPVSEEVLAAVGKVLTPADEVHVLTVIDPSQIHETLSAGGPVVIEALAASNQLGATAAVMRHPAAEDVVQAAERVDAERLQALEALARRALPPALQWTAHVRAGAHPADVILAIADEIHAEALAVGTRARRDVVQALLGSVAEDVIRRTDLPVIVIRVGHHST